VIVKNGEFNRARPVAGVDAVPPRPDCLKTVASDRPTNAVCGSTMQNHLALGHRPRPLWSEEVQVIPLREPTNQVRFTLNTR
jgi:hypothetical protein